MYGVPDDLPLGQFVGETIARISMDKYQITFSITGLDSLVVQGAWELRDAAGQVIDLGQEHDKRNCYRIHRLIDDPIVSFAIDPPHSFTLVFETGHALVIFDDSDQYESFIIQFEGMSPIIV